MSTDPSKVNALRKLTEAANAIGWAVSTKSGDLAIESGDGSEVYVDNFGGRRFLCTNNGVEAPVELVLLLLEASR